MNKIYSLLFLFFSFLFSSAQVGQWTWMSGSNSFNNTPSYGTKGVPSATNNPPGLYEATEWTDHQGNFWLYGGMLPFTSGSVDAWGDLWKFDPSTNMWTWMKGPGTLNPTAVYGTQGVPAPTNNPGQHLYAAESWVDNNGNLWLMGGDKVVGSITEMNDLWEYNISTNNWTWMKGSQTSNPTGSTGTQGVENASNEPWGTSENAAAWSDNNGYLWLFSNGLIWKYNIATNNWIWVSGNSATCAVTYGTKGVTDSSNYPGCAAAYSHWKDKSGNLWIFLGGSLTGSLFMNILWKYDVTTNLWTWVSGLNTVSSSGSFKNPGNYGTLCAGSVNNLPWGRSESRACWTDACGNFWSFGGFRGSSGGNIVAAELWHYNPTNNEWMVAGGDTVINAPTVYGTKGVSASTNQPGARFGSVGFMDLSGNLWMYGGSGPSYGLNAYNDLWRFVPDSNCTGTCTSVVVAPPTANFAASDTSLCQYDCINYTDLSLNATSWQWIFDGATPSSSAAQNPQNVCYPSTGMYNTTLIAANSSGSDTLVFTNYIHVNTTPPFTSITQVDSILYCTTDPSYISYQWYFNSNLIPGATDTSYVATSSGNYNVSVKNIYGCSVSVGINILLGIEQFATDGLQLTISPNPVGKELIIIPIKSGGELKIKEINIYNMLGEKALTLQSSIINRQSSIVIDVSSLSSGIYFVQIANESKRWVGRFVKE